MARPTYKGSIEYYRDMMQADRERKVVEHFYGTLRQPSDAPSMPAVRRRDHLRLVHDADQNEND